MKANNTKMLMEKKGEIMVYRVKFDFEFNDASYPSKAWVYEQKGQVLWFNYMIFGDSVVASEEEKKAIGVFMTDFLKEIIANMKM